MATHYHGMTQSAYDVFCKGETKIVGPWECSDRDNYTYLHSVSKAVESGECEDDNADDYCIQQAIESAILQACLHGDSFVYVMHVTIPENYEYIEDDHSCPNMSDFADCIPEGDFKGFVTAITKYEINPYYAPFILAMLMNRTYASVHCAKPEIMAVAETLQNVLHHIDSETWFNYEFHSEVTV